MGEGTGIENGAGMLELGPDVREMIPRTQQPGQEGPSEGYGRRLTWRRPGRPGPREPGETKGCIAETGGWSEFQHIPPSM